MPWSRKRRPLFFALSLSWTPDAHGEFGSVVAAVKFLVA